MARRQMQQLLQSPRPALHKPSDSFRMLNACHDSFMSLLLVILLIMDDAMSGTFFTFSSRSFAYAWSIYHHHIWDPILSGDAILFHYLFEHIRSCVELRTKFKTTFFVIISGPIVIGEFAFGEGYRLIDIFFDVRSG